MVVGISNSVVVATAGPSMSVAASVVLTVAAVVVRTYDAAVVAFAVVAGMLIQVDKIGVAWGCCSVDC